MNSREVAIDPEGHRIEDSIAKLRQLSDPSLEKANQLLDSLLQEQDKPNSPSQETLKAKWEKWFVEVDQLEVSPDSSPDEYEQHLVNKYRLAGIRCMILCDAGVLLCLVDRTQPLHQPYRKAVISLQKPLITTWSC